MKLFSRHTKVWRCEHAGTERHCYVITDTINRAIELGTDAFIRDDRERNPNSDAFGTFADIKVTIVSESVEQEWTSGVCGCQ